MFWRYGIYPVVFCKNGYLHKVYASPALLVLSACLHVSAVLRPDPSGPEETGLSSLAKLQIKDINE